MPTTEIDPRRGEVWQVDLDPTVGSELAKSRPCVVLNRRNVGRLRVRVIVPLTGWQPAFASYPWCVQVAPEVGSGLTKTSCADTFQIRCASLDRMAYRLGTLSDETTDHIAATIAYTVGYKFPDT